jgi:hypothetical protein
MLSQTNDTSSSKKKPMAPGSITRESNKRKNSQSSSELPDIKNSKGFSDKTLPEHKPYAIPGTILLGN